MAQTSLRPLELGDVPALTALLRENREHLRRWDPRRTDDFFTEDEQIRRARSTLAEMDAGDSAAFVITDGDELLGRLTLSGIVRGVFQSCAMGYWVRADRLGRGHATRAVELATAHAFGELGLHRVQAETVRENVASQIVLRRNGFTQYGVAPKYLEINGRWRDHRMFQLLAEDAPPRPAPPASTVVDVITTERLALRQMTADDIDDIAGLLGDPDVMRYYPRPKTREEARRWIDWNRGLYRDHGFGLWYMTLAQSGEFIGECGLTIQMVDGVPEVEVGYHVLPAHQGRGYATEAAAACRDAAREMLGSDRIIAVISPDNRPSQIVAERIGLRLEKHAEMYGEGRLIYASPGQT